MQEIKGDSVKKNFIYQSAYQVLSIILPLITAPYIARVLGKEGVGVYSYTNSIMYFFLIFANLGISNYGNREIAAASYDRKKLSETFWGIYFCHIVITGVSSLIYVVYIINATHYRVAFICQFVQLLATFFDITWFFTGLQKFKITVRRNFIVRIITVICVFLFVKESTHVWRYILILAAGNLVGQMSIWTRVRKYVDFKRVSVRTFVSHIKPMIILFIPVIAMSIYRYLDKIMIPHYSNISQLGLYENAEKIMNLPLSFITSIGIVLLPKMANLERTGDRRQESKYFNLSMKYSMLLAYAITFGLIGIAPVFVPIFLGDEFTDCIKLLSVISVTILFLTLSNTIRSQYLIPKKKDKAFVVAAFSGAIVNLLLNIILIKSHGAMGAVIATVITEIVVAIIHVIYSKKDIDFVSIAKSTIFFIIPAFLMCVIVRLIGNTMGVKITTFITQVIVGCVFYLVLSGGYLIITKDEVICNYIKRKVLKK